MSTWRFNSYYMLANKFDTVTHRIASLLNPLTTNGDGCRSFHGYCKHTEELCWHTGKDKDERMIKTSCKTKIGCGKQPIRTNTLPVSAANKWRQERVHSTEKASPIPLHTLLVSCYDLQQHQITSVWTAIQNLDWSKSTMLIRRYTLIRRDTTVKIVRSSWFCTYRLTFN
jgi:hypothetical protein